MTVKELIEALKEMPQDLEVLIEQDNYPKVYDVALAPEDNFLNFPRSVVLTIEK